MTTNATDTSTRLKICGAGQSYRPVILLLFFFFFFFFVHENWQRCLSSTRPIRRKSVQNFSGWQRTDEYAKIRWAFTWPRQTFTTSKQCKKEMAQVLVSTRSPFCHNKLVPVFQEEDVIHQYTVSHKFNVVKIDFLLCFFFTVTRKGQINAIMYGRSNCDSHEHLLLKPWLFSEDHMHLYRLPIWSHGQRG